MKKIQTIFVALCCLSSAACAQSEPRLVGENPPGNGRYSAISNGIVQNANVCPPDRAEAVWGAGSALLGYRCITPSAN